MSMPVHHRIQWVLAPCGHTVNCNCNHTIGGPAFCMVCQKMRTVEDVNDQQVYAERPSPIRPEKKVTDQ